MKISKIKIENFKSFQNVEINFNKLNLFIGANAAGKSNLIYVFELLKNIQKKGLAKTFSNKYFRLNELKKSNSKERFWKIYIEIKVNEIDILEKSKNCIVRVRDTISYDIEISPEDKNYFKIREEVKFNEYFAEYSLENNEPKEELQRLSSNFKYGILNNLGKFETYSNEKELQFFDLSDGQSFNIELENPFHYKFISQLNLKYKRKSILEFGIFTPSELFDFGIYDINPKKAKGSNVDAYAEFLEKDGENLIQIINQILTDEDKSIREQFIADVSGILDFIEDIKVEQFNGVLTLKVKESWNKTFTDGHLLSDGTISIIAMVVALYYQENNIVIIEEPEHGIHPKLLSHLIEMCNGVADYKNKQIFITTHNPVLLKNIYSESGFDNIFTIQRDRKSNSSFIKKPNINSFKDFLEDFSQEGLDDFIEEIGIDNLFVQNSLK